MPKLLIFNVEIIGFLIAYRRRWTVLHALLHVVPTPRKLSQPVRPVSRR